MTNSAYQDNLRHIAEPQAPSEREKATSVPLEDYVALWFADVLREYAHYEADDPHSGIAVGYASYIDTKVRDEGNSWVELYVHTHEAAVTLDSAAAFADDAVDPDDLIEATSSLVEGLETDDSEPRVVEIDGEETVVYDEKEARSSYAMMQMEKSEAEAMQKVEEARERHFDENGHF